MKRKIECPICKNTKLTVLKVIDDIKILECKTCDLGISSKNKGVDLYSGESLYDINAYKEAERRQIEKFKKISSIINRLEVKNILEVGAGYGLFGKILSENRRLKIDLIEPNLSPIYSKSVKRIKHHKVSFDDFAKKNKNQYDLVVFLDVFEHLENPRAVIRKARGHLKMGGYILILLPNYKSAMAKICKNWSWWMIEDHKYHYSPSSLRKLLTEGGFLIAQVKTFEDYYDFRKNLDGNFTNHPNSHFRKAKKAAFLSLFIPLYLIFRKILWRLNFGGLLLMVGKKQ